MHSKSMFSFYFARSVKLELLLDTVFANLEKPFGTFLQNVIWLAERKPRQRAGHRLVLNTEREYHSCQQSAWHQ